MTRHGAIDSEEPTSTPKVHDPVVLKLGPLRFKLSQLRYITFSLIGIALLWPWNAFLSASAYYGDRFASTTSLIKIYSSTMMTVSTLTSTFLNYYLSQVQKGVDYNRRVNIGLIITVVVFVIMAFSCISYFFINMNDKLFFSVLMLMVFVSAVATCLAQNGTMAIVNVLGGIYANAVMVGQAVAGVLPSVALVISILSVGEHTNETKKVEKDYGVFVYYITASLISLVSLFFFWWVNAHKTATQYTLLENALDETEEDIDPEPVIQQTHIAFGHLWSKLKFIVMTIFLTFGVTLIFPVFASTVESVHYDSTHIIFRKNIFIPLIYLTWNLGDLLGRIFCGAPNSKFLIKNPRTLIIYSVARLIYIPLFMTCNIHLYTALLESSAFINSDIWYVLLQFTFGLSNGQLSTSAFMIVGSALDTDEEKEAAGGFTTVFLSLGLAAGSLFSYLLVIAVN